jgi:uncharacterized protein
LRVDDCTGGRGRQALAAILLILTLLAGRAQAFETGSLAIQTQDGRVETFTIELATTPADRTQGLMFRESMDPDHGMLFDFQVVAPVSMWMRNTIVPLDMLFIGEDGRIKGIAANTVPFSETVIASPGAVRAVLELNAGSAERLRITTGDRVRHPIFEEAR